MELQQRLEQLGYIIKNVTISDGVIDIIASNDIATWILTDQSYYLNNKFGYISGIRVYNNVADNLINSCDDISVHGNIHWGSELYTRSMFSSNHDYYIVAYNDFMYSEIY